MYAAKNQSCANLNPVSSVGTNDQVVRDARRLEVAGHSQREGVAADLGGRLAHHEAADGLLGEHLERNFARDARLEPRRRQQSLFLFLGLRPQTVGTLWGRRRGRPS